MKITLLGYMGSGKSSVGKILAEALDFTFFDLDQVIEQKEGMSIPQIFQKKGEIYFRKQEAVILKEVLLEDKKIVLALGGGTPCFGNVMNELNALDDVLTVYLKNNLNTLTKRLYKEKEQRPMISHLETKELLDNFIRKHLFERGFYYNQAQFKQDCDGLTLQEIVEQLVLRLF